MVTSILRRACLDRQLLLRQDERRWSTHAAFIETPSSSYCYGTRRTALRTKVVGGMPSKRIDGPSDYGELPGGLPIPSSGGPKMGPMSTPTTPTSCFDGARDPRLSRSLSPEAFIHPSRGRGPPMTGAFDNNGPTRHHRRLPRNGMPLGRSNLSPTSKDTRTPEPWNPQVISQNHCVSHSNFPRDVFVTTSMIRVLRAERRPIPTRECSKCLSPMTKPDCHPFSLPPHINVAAFSPGIPKAKTTLQHGRFQAVFIPIRQT